MPRTGAETTLLPAAVVVVWVPWPSLSRAESGYTSVPGLMAL